MLCRKTTLWRIRHIYSAYELSAGVRVGLDYLIIIFRHRPCHRRNCCRHHQHCDCVFVYLGWREFKCRSRSWDSHLAILPSCIFPKLLLLLWLVMPTTTTSATTTPLLPLLCHCCHYCATAASLKPCVFSAKLTAALGLHHNTPRCSKKRFSSNQGRGKSDRIVGGREILGLAHSHPGMSSSSSRSSSPPPSSSSPSSSPPSSP